MSDSAGCAGAEFAAAGSSKACICEAMLLAIPIVARPPRKVRRATVGNCDGCALVVPVW